MHTAKQIEPKERYYKFVYCYHYYVQELNNDITRLALVDLCDTFQCQEETFYWATKCT